MSAVLYHKAMMDHRKTGAFGESYNLKNENLDSNECNEVLNNLIDQEYP
jgi:hypothetical protein